MPKQELTKEEEIVEVYEWVKKSQLALHRAKQHEENAKLETQKAQKEALLAKDAQWALERGQ